MKSIKVKFIFSLMMMVSCQQAESQYSTSKINGISFVAPAKPVDSTWTKQIKNTNAGWVAIIPYAFCRKNQPEVYYNAERQYWGESLTGAKENIKQAHKAGLKVMVKPQIWMEGGWVGDFNLQNEAQWKTWEEQYQSYLMLFALLAADEKADMLCIGTELKNVVLKRPQFWSSLAKKIRKVYNGKLTYCANWDDYEQVKFWKDLDYIGISAYFPLVEDNEPTVKSLQKAWEPVKDQLENYSKNQQKQVLFTEFGYRSITQPAWRSWELEYKNMPINMKAQANSYEALFLSLWKENWFAGGFAWKWYASFRRQDPVNNDDWTPQNKPAEAIISKYYKNTSAKF